MIHKKLIKIICILVFFTSIKSIAQPFQTGIGLRMGGISSGITVKHFISSTSAIEGILGFGRHSFSVTGLFEKHTPFPNAEGLTWFYGGGAHVGFFNNDYRYDYFYYKSHHNKVYVFQDGDSNFSLGGDFIIGLDYKFKNAPVNLSLDVKPFVDILPGVYGYWEGALSIRFTL